MSGSTVSAASRSALVRHGDLHTARRPHGDGSPTLEDSAGDRRISWTIGTVIILGTTVVVALTFPDLRHWFLVPVALCGVLVIPDAVDWARGRLDIFDPQAVLGLLGTHFFYIAPMLHVTLDYWPRYEDVSGDWREALGQMAVLNLLGLLVYRAVWAPRLPRVDAPLPNTDVRRLLRLAVLLALATGTAFIILVMALGGPLAYIHTMADERQELAGMGPVLLVSKIFPTAALAAALVRFRASIRRHPSLLVLVLPLYVLTEMFVAGLGGSRSHTVWSLLIGVGLCHLLIRPLRRSTLVILTIVLVTFMYFYGFYKDNGTKALEALTGGTSISELSASTGRDLPAVFLQDLGRSDIQALVLEHQRAGVAPLQYGVTYIGDLAFLIPDTLGRNIPNKVVAGTNMLRGAGTYSPDFASSRIYGLTGEAILNFGSIGAVSAFLLLGLVMRATARFYRRCLASPDAIGARLLAPSLSIAVTLTLTSDVDNLAWFLINYTLLPAVLAWSTREHAPGREVATFAIRRPPVNQFLR